MQAPTNPRTHPKSHQLRKPTQSRGRQPALTNPNRNQSPRGNTVEVDSQPSQRGRRRGRQPAHPTGNASGNTVTPQNALAKPSQQRRSRDSHGAGPHAPKSSRPVRPTASRAAHEVSGPGPLRPLLPLDSLNLFDPAPTEPRPQGRRLGRKNPTTAPQPRRTTAPRGT